LKWFKHISDSLTDPFICSLIVEFGPRGYLVFFGTLELYAREYKTDRSRINPLHVPCRLVAQFVHESRQSSVKKVLKYIADSGKWFVEFNGKYVDIYIPKFDDLIDESTRKKLRAREQKASGKLPEKNQPIDLDLDKDKEKKRKEKSLEPEAASRRPACPHQQIIELYHQILPELPKVQVWNDDRQSCLRARWREDRARQHLDWWINFFNHVRGSPFLMGNVKKFQADLEWLIRPKNFPKVLEGRYHEQSGSGKTNKFKNWK
jgi:hypothetical protein